jgi:hypothetical protein
MGCNAVYSVEIQPTFRRNMLQLSSGSKNKPNNKTRVPEHRTQVLYSPENKADIDANVMVDWIHVAQDRDQWRALVNAVLKVRAG